MKCISKKYEMITPIPTVRTLSNSLNELECNVIKCNVYMKCSLKKCEMITLLPR